MKKTTLQLLLLFSITVIGQTTYNIDNPEDLRNVLYQPGDVIILKNGVYDTDERMRFLGSGTSENPVIFRAETPGGVIFTGKAKGSALEGCHDFCHRKVILFPYKWEKYSLECPKLSPANDNNSTKIAWRESHMDDFSVTPSII